MTLTASVPLAEAVHHLLVQAAGLPEHLVACEDEMGGLVRRQPGGERDGPGGACPRDLLCHPCAESQDLARPGEREGRGLQAIVHRLDRRPEFGDSLFRTR